MHNGFYNLNQDPFRLTPDPAFAYMTTHHREALAGLVYSVCTRPGLTVLIGEVGTGKTTLLYTLLGLLEKRRFVVAMCTNPTLSREEFYDLLVIKLRIECSSQLKSRQLVALQESLERNRADGRPTVLIVDEAQRLSPAVLEEIRLLLNMETPREKLLQIIMAGQSELAEILRRPDLRQLKQRISYFCRVQPLALEEVRQYLNFRLAKAGLPQQSLFSDATVELIYKYTDGIPRLINTLCHSCLQTGFALQSSTITPAIIHEAARDLDLVQSLSLRDLNLNEMDDSGPHGVDPAGEDQVSKHSVTTDSGRNGRRVSKEGEDSTSRKKSDSLFGSLIDRWG